MLNRWNLKVAEFASKKESRYTLKAILVRPDATVATNGHYLIWVSTPAAHKAMNFPVIDHAPTVQDDFPPFLMSPEDAKKIEKALPRKSTIPILLTAGVAVRDGQLIVEVTDLECPQVFRPNPLKGTFPNYEVTMPKEEPVAKFCVNAAYLAQIAKFAAEFQQRSGIEYKPLTVSFYGADRALKFECADSYEGQGMTAMLMPVKLDGNEHPAHTYGWVRSVAPAPEPSADEAGAELANTEQEQDTIADPEDLGISEHAEEHAGEPEPQAQE